MADGCHKITVPEINGWVRESFEDNRCELGRGAWAKRENDDGDTETVKVKMQNNDAITICWGASVPTLLSWKCSIPLLSSRDRISC